MRIGIDLGGTKIEGLVLDDAGAEKARMRVPLPPPPTRRISARSSGW
jgi:predicted NBD/HSP70 family sugar kinase